MLEETNLSTETFPVAQRRQAWIDALAELAFATVSDANAPFTGDLSIKNFSDGARFAVLTSGPQMLIRRKVAGISPTLVIFLLTKGVGQIHVGANTTEISDGDLWVFEANSDWKIELGVDFELLLLEVPSAPLLSRMGRSGVRLPKALGTSVAALSAGAIMRTLAANIAMIAQADLSAAETAIVELVHSDLLAESKSDQCTTQAKAGHFRRITAAIETKLGDPKLSMSVVAQSERISVRYLQRLFEQNGTTFSEFVKQRRLHRSRADLVDRNHADKSISEIAWRWGFRDHAHFSRSFNLAFSLSPREQRRIGLSKVEGRRNRGRPLVRANFRENGRHSESSAPPPADISEIQDDFVPDANNAASEPEHHYLAANSKTVHWGYLSRAIPPVLSVGPDSIVTIETLTQHSYDDYDRMVAGDSGAESVFAWTSKGKAIDRRGAGPMDASVLGRGAGEGFGVHICTGPVYVRGAEAGDVLEIEILSITPRPSYNPLHAGKCFASNAAAWWGFQYNDYLNAQQRREITTIYEISLKDPAFAQAIYSYVWKPQTDPFGVRHDTMDYPGLPIDRSTIEEVRSVLKGVRIPARPHFGFIATAPREMDLIDSIPPGYFGGNMDNWRAGEGARIYLPVSVPGALLSIGDGHFALGDGEINGTGLECSLTGQFRVRLHKSGQSSQNFLSGLNFPLIETRDAWIVQSFSFGNYLRELGHNAQTEVYNKSTVDLALRNAFRQTRKFLMDKYGLREEEALSLMSAAVDFGITQVADGNFGVHATIRKEMFTERGANGM